MTILETFKSLVVVVVHKVIIVSVCVLYAGLHRYTQVTGLEKFSGGGGGWVVHADWKRFS